MDGREIKDEHYRWGYQGQYAEKDTVTGFNEFQLRMYDARFGRWLSADPYGQYHSPYMAMGNVPQMSVDGDGGWSWVAAGAGFAVGAGMGCAATGDWQGALAGGLAGGAMGGVSFTQGKSGAGSKFNGGFRETGGLRVTFNSNLYASVGNFIENIDLFPTALFVTKHAFSTIARRAAEEHFVKKNFDSNDHSKLKKDYRRFSDSDGDYYSGFTEPHSVNVNELLGSNPGPYRGRDSDTGEEVGINRIFPKVTLNVSVISKLRWIGGYGFTDGILNGYGYDLQSSSHKNAASLIVVFKTQKAAKNFYTKHFTKSFNQKMAEMSNRYFKVHK